MKLKLDFDIKQDLRINYKQPLLSIGSCFAESISQKLKDNRFNCIANPNGIVYNPLSIARSINKALSGEDYTSKELAQSNGLWFSWNHHGRFSKPSEEEALSDINRTLADLKTRLREDKLVVFITFGSAWVYELDGNIVANCHKQPNSTFNHRLLSVDEIVTAYQPILAALNNVEVMFTVSPVRYTKEGLEQNTLSKSTLHLAVSNLVGSFKNVHYFPSYEIVLDELRDHRFFADDLVHPNQLAVDYVWSRFGDSFFDEQTKEMTRAWNKVKRQLNHRILHPELPESKKFLESRRRDLDEFEQQYFS